MPQRKSPTAKPKSGPMEILLLSALILVVIVTAWTLIDNGLMDMVFQLIDSQKSP